MLSALIDRALAAVEPGAAVRRALAVRRDTLAFGSLLLPLRALRRAIVVGAGKAAAPMAAATVEALAGLPVEGLVIVPYGYGAPAGPVVVREAGHPLPDRAGLVATGEIEQMLTGTTEQDLVVALISGGGSALLTAPAGNLTLDDLTATNAALVDSSLPIEAINAVRKRLDRLKGGGLAKAASPATLIALIVSDVVGSPLDAIASGPTVPDTTTWHDAVAAVDRATLWDALPGRVVDRLRAGAAGQAEQPLGPRDPAFATARSVVIADSRIAAGAVLEAAEEQGLNALLLTTSLEGEANQAGRFLGSILREVVTSGSPVGGPCCLVASGETTVTLRGGGLGGRNQELALGAARSIAGLEGVLLASIGTDGRDGPTDVAGAWVDGGTIARAGSLGWSAEATLAGNDSYRFFDSVGGHLRLGPTRTNVGDLMFLLALGRTSRRGG
ncbi:MAG: DUF4147 domain-containing protein [Dehalococcoidia bacterium]